MNGGTDIAGLMGHMATAFCVESPIPERELKTITRSIENKDYLYKCSLPMFKSVCDSTTCKSLTCGITADDLDTMPLFGQLTQYINVDPPMYDLPVTVGGVTHQIKRIPHRVLAFYGELKIFIMKSRVMVPNVKPADWDQILEDLLNNAKLEEMPEEITTNGLLKNAILQFCASADPTPTAEGPVPVLKRGLPAVATIAGQQMVMFRAVDFSHYLVKQKVPVPPSMIEQWYSAKDSLGVQRQVVGTGVNKFTAWMIPWSEVPSQAKPPTEFKSDF
jgi:hypothetical protein